jgi:F-type H+-transporting ATPase subunit b
MEHHAAPTIGQLLFPLINFVLFVALLVRFLGQPIREHFRSRAEQLRDALAAGARARDAAEALRAQLARDIADLPALRERLRSDLRAAAERERDTLLALGRQAAERIRTDARLLADHELAAARDALRNETIDEAVRQATALVRHGLRPDDQDRYVREFVAATGSQA